MSLLVSLVKDNSPNDLKTALLNNNNFDSVVNSVSADLDNTYPLHYAIFNGYDEISALLIRTGKVNASLQDQDGNTILHLVAATENSNGLKLIVENMNCDWNIKNKFGKTPYECCNNNEREFSELMNYYIKNSLEAMEELKLTIEYVNTSFPDDPALLKFKIRLILEDHFIFQKNCKALIYSLVEEKYSMQRSNSSDDISNTMLHKEIYRLRRLNDEYKEKNRSLGEFIMKNDEQHRKAIEMLIKQHAEEIQKLVSLSSDSKDKTEDTGNRKVSSSSLASTRSKLSIGDTISRKYSSSTVKTTSETSKLSKYSKSSNNSSEKLGTLSILRRKSEKSDSSANLIEKDQTQKDDSVYIKVDNEDVASGKLVFFQNDSGQKQVKAATLEKLLERIVCGISSDRYVDNQFIQTFLLTYRVFVDKYKVLDFLTEKFKIINMNSKGASTDLLRICNTLKNWIENYWFDFLDDPKMISSINAFIEECKEINPKLATILSRVYQSKIVSGNVLTPAGRASQKSLPKSISIADLGKDRYENLQEFLTSDISDVSKHRQFLEFDPQEIAKQLTLIEHALFTAIKPIEFIDTAWMKDDKETRAPNICNMTKWSNHIVGWVVTEIVSQTESLKNRILIYERLVSVAWYLEKLNNFNGIKEILAGLQSSAIHRLKKTRDGISSKYTKILETLTKETGSEMNYKALRAKIHEVSPPLIPFPGVYQKDLVFLDECSRSVVENGLLNFQKFLKVSSYIFELQSYQQKSYDIEISSELHNYLTSYKVMSEDEAYSNSLICEPRS